MFRQVRALLILRPMLARVRDGFSSMDVLARLEDFVLHYSGWKVGLTQNPLTCKTDVGSPEGWRYWLMSSAHEAQSLSRILIRQGMAPCELTQDSGRYLYIYPTESERFVSGELIYLPEQLTRTN